MKVWLEHGNLESLGILSLFRQQRFVLRVALDDGAHRLSLKAKKGYIGYIFESPKHLITFEVVINSRTVEAVIVDVDSNKKIKFANEFFRGHITLRKLKASAFVELENGFLRAKSLPPIDTFSVAVSCVSGLAIRELYNGVLYAVDVQRESIKLVESQSDEKLPYGWEERRTATNRRFYIDNVNRITQWQSPLVEKKKLGDALAKTLECFDNLNIFSLFQSPVVLDVKRKFAIQSSYEKVISSAHALHNVELRIKFADEIGGDGGGLLREYFELVAAELALDHRLEADDDIYDVSSVNMDEHPAYNPCFCENEANAGKNQTPTHDFLIYVGMIMGLAIRCSSPLRITFSLCFYESLLQKEYSLRKVQDTIYQASLLKVLRSTEDLSAALSADLSTREKKERYVSDVLRQKYLGAKADLYAAVKKGFFNIVPASLAKTTTSYILNTLVTGPKSISVAALLPHMIYISCSASTREIEFLWAILRDKRPWSMHKFLRFCTGSSTISTNLLLNNTFKLTIEQQNQHNMLFRSSTCISRLWIGTYATIDDMDRIFVMCMNETEGFHVV